MLPGVEMHQGESRGCCNPVLGKRGKTMAELQSVDRVATMIEAAIESGREELFDIVESARAELDYLRPALETAAAREELADGGRQEQTAELELEFMSLTQVVERAGMLMTRLGLAKQCLDESVPDVAPAEILAGQRRTAQLSLKLLDHERHRIAREIHDGPAQALANLLLRTVFCQQRMDGKSPVVQDELSNLKEVVRGSMLEIRKILFDLQPKGLDQDLVPCLHRLCREYHDRWGLAVMFDCTGKERPLDNQLAVGLFRIVQEALNNICQHSGADQAGVKLGLKEHQITVEISDGGKGFDLEEASALNGHYGLMNMQERARLLDGTLQIRTAPGQGTCVGIIVPVKKATSKK
jgi:two-component system sensor histidine kinase DegS